MNHSDPNSVVMRSALLLRPFPDTTGIIELPSSTIAYVWGTFRSNDEPISRLGRVFLPGPPHVVSVNLKISEFESGWIWEQHRENTLLVPLGLLQKINEICNAGFGSGTEEQLKDGMVEIWRLVQYPLGPDFDHTGEPIYEHLREWSERLSRQS